MTDESIQTKFSFDEIQDTSFLSVQDVKEGSTVIVKKGDAEGQIEKLRVNFAPKDEAPEYQDVFILNCEIDGEKSRLKVSKTTLFKLKRICASNPENLEGKKFQMLLAGKGKFKYIDLILSS